MNFKILTAAGLLLASTANLSAYDKEKVEIQLKSILKDRFKALKDGAHEVPTVEDFKLIEKTLESGRLLQNNRQIAQLSLQDKEDIVTYLEREVYVDGGPAGDYLLKMSVNHDRAYRGDEDRGAAGRAQNIIHTLIRKISSSSDQNIITARIYLINARELLKENDISGALKNLNPAKMWVNKFSGAQKSQWLLDIESINNLLNNVQERVSLQVQTSQKSPALSVNPIEEEDTFFDAKETMGDDTISASQHTPVDSGVSSSTTSPQRGSYPVSLSTQQSQDDYETAQERRPAPTENSLHFRHSLSKLDASHEVTPVTEKDVEQVILSLKRELKLLGSKEDFEDIESGAPTLSMEEELAGKNNFPERKAYYESKLQELKGGGAVKPESVDTEEAPVSDPVLRRPAHETPQASQPFATTPAPVHSTGQRRGSVSSKALQVKPSEAFTIPLDKKTPGTKPEIKGYKKDAHKHELLSALAETVKLEKETLGALRSNLLSLKNNKFAVESCVKLMNQFNTSLSKVDVAGTRQRVALCEQLGRIIEEKLQDSSTQEAFAELKTQVDAEKTYREQLNKLLAQKQQGGEAKATAPRLSVSASSSQTKRGLVAKKPVRESAMEEALPESDLQVIESERKKVLENLIALGKEIEVLKKNPTALMKTQKALGNLREFYGTESIEERLKDMEKTQFEERLTKLTTSLRDLNKGLTGKEKVEKISQFEREIIRNARNLWDLAHQGK